MPAMAFSGGKRVIAAVKTLMDTVALAPDKGISMADLVQEMDNAVKRMRPGSLGFTIKKLISFFEQHFDHHDSPPVFEIQS